MAQVEVDLAVLAQQVSTLVDLHKVNAELIRAQQAELGKQQEQLTRTITVLEEHQRQQAERTANRNSQYDELAKRQERSESVYRSILIAVIVTLITGGGATAAKIIGVV